MKKATFFVLLALVLRTSLWGPAALAQVNVGSAPYIFVPGTTISSSEVNANFSRIYSDALDRTGGTMTGTLTTQAIVPAADNTYDLGTTLLRWRNIYVVGSVGSVGGALSAISTSPPQFTVGYDGSNKLDVSVASNGATTFNTSGSGQAFTFSDNVTASGTLTVNGGFVGGGTGSFADTVTISKASGTGLSLTSSNASVGGTLAVTGTSTLTGVVTAGTGLTVTTGGVTVSAGGVILSAGPLVLPIRTETTSPQTATTSNVVIIANSATAFTLNLFQCSGNTGKVLVIKDLGANDTTVDPDGSEQIDGSSTKTVSTTASAIIICDGTAWYTIG